MSWDLCLVEGEGLERWIARSEEPERICFGVCE